MATTRQSKSKHSVSAGKNTDDLDASANNQKPGDECGTCSVVVGANNKALSCEICDKWYHIKCESIPESVYNFMVHDKAGKQLIWHCSYCQRGCVKVYKHMKIIVADQLELETKQNVLQEEIKTVRECITQEIGAMKDIEARVGSMEAMLADKNEKIDKMWKVEDTFKDQILAVTQQFMEENLSNSQDIKQTFSNAVKEAIDGNKDLNMMVKSKVDEALDQAQAKPRPDSHETRQVIRQQVFYLRKEEERRNNLIIHNLQETAELTPEETRKQDITTFMQIVNICGAPIQEQDVLDCRRLGQTVSDKNKHRPVLIKLVSEEKKRNLFVRLGAWRKYQQEHRGPEDITAGKPLINIDHDMTQEQRKDRRSLVEEAKNLNAKLPVDVKTRWTVRGPPWNMRVLKVILVPPNPNHQ
ncbi:hypothetical protein Pcinc_011797 [Petrolisthes cinctipes]|uniref:PHD-type domain-containing protein n=1 Tax=Petrolisthes cinctipes TaxID=88211 RepID=A0AAE1G1W8_PETCI|nr:hypothetical protein Pcinc_011797 [Petrolisthes cinctipes]